MMVETLGVYSIIFVSNTNITPIKENSILILFLQINMEKVIKDQTLLKVHQAVNYSNTTAVLMVFWQYSSRGGNWLSNHAGRVEMLF
jgi:hypothetical protein